MVVLLVLSNCCKLAIQQFNNTTIQKDLFLGINKYAVFLMRGLLWAALFFLFEYRIMINECRISKYRVGKSNPN